MSILNVVKISFCTGRDSHVCYLSKGVSRLHIRHVPLQWYTDPVANAGRVEKLN